MFGSGLASTRRVLGAVIVSTLVVGGAAVSSSGAALASRPASRATAPATGTPVKVGLITTGGDCQGCSGQLEEPAAEAAVKWANAKHNGLAGHPMQLDVCVSSNDPGKESDCANQMIRDGVVAVIEGSGGNLVTSWRILHDAGIPFINHSTTEEAILADAQSTFILYDPLAQTVTLPIEVAKAKKAKKVSVIVVDVPAATDIYKSAASRFKQAGIKLDLVPVALGVGDMSTQAQQILTDNPNGVVSIIGHDAFCIPALNALHAVGFQGTLTTISFCITDAMRKAAPADVIKGMTFGSEAPAGANDASMREYKSALQKYAPEKVDPNDQTAITTFQGISALSVGTKKLQGDVTPASVTAALKAMDNEVLPAAGGRLFRCNGKASTAGPAICSASTVTSSLNASGKPTKYTTSGNKPIPD